jgi:hypothetical protein
VPPVVVMISGAFEDEVNLMLDRIVPSRIHFTAIAQMNSVHAAVDEIVRT